MQKWIKWKRTQTLFNLCCIQWESNSNSGQLPGSSLCGALLIRFHIKTLFLITALCHIRVSMLSLIIVQPLCVGKAQLVYAQRTVRTFSPVCFLSAPAVLNDADLHHFILHYLLAVRAWWPLDAVCFLSDCAHPLLISHFKHAWKHSQHIMYSSALFPSLTSQPHIRETELSAS